MDGASGTAGSSGTENDGYAVVAGHWPLAGPHSPLRTAYAAQALTALVRYLDHATASADALPALIDVDGVQHAVTGALTDLPRVLTAAEARRARLMAG